MDPNEKLAYVPLTEKDLICEDCLWRGEQEGLVVSKCLVYKDLKPLHVLSKGKQAKCSEYTKEPN